MRKRRRASVLTTLLFTDIVAATAMAEELGDRRWRELLARHHSILRDALREFRGRELDTAGDGVFARFDSPASAVRCACAIADAVRKLGIEIRAGIHIGEAEMFDGKLSGVNVHAGARTMAEAGPGQILVTSSVRDIVRGGGFGFADRGLRELRGIEGEWQLFEVTSVDGTPRPPVPSAEEARSRRDAIVPPPLVKRRRVRLTALATALAAVVAGSALAITLTFGGSSSTPLTGCMVAPIPPLNDRSFKQAVFDGLTDAATTWGIRLRTKVSRPTDDYERTWVRDIQAFAKQGCGLIVTVGGFMGPATAAVARRNPTQKFLTTDAEVVRRPDNLANVVFEVDQAAFQAGYLAAGVTKTGKVATFGAVPIPVVTAFMRGFAAGVLYYNQRNNAEVRLVGWDLHTQTGTFISKTPSQEAFEDTAAAKRITAGFIRAGADVIMPVAGQNGGVAAARAAQASEGVLLIGVDADQHFATPQYVALWLTSVLKVYRRMVYLAMGKVVHDQFEGGVLRGTLANGGVGLAPFYGLANGVPRSLRKELREITRGIANRSISIDPASYVV